MNLSVKDAAQLLAVSEKTIYRWLKQGLVPVYRVNESYRFKRAELLDWATSRRVGVAPEAFNEPESSGEPLPTFSEALELGGVFYRIEGKTRNEALGDAVEHLRLPDEFDRHYLTQVLIARERLSSTALGEGIAIPHPRSPGLMNLTRATVTLCFLEQPVDFKALDGRPVGVLLLILAPYLRAHLHLLSRLGFALKDAAFRQALLEVESRERIFSVLKSAEERIRQP